MIYLLDTHTFIWFIEGDSSLPESVRKSITDPSSKNFISIASIWEIAIKINVGKLILQTPFPQIEKKINENDFQILPVSFGHTQVLTTLPHFHKDPFDRMIIAQSITEDLTVISKDKNFSLYPIKLLW